MHVIVTFYSMSYLLSLLIDTCSGTQNNTAFI